MFNDSVNMHSVFFFYPHNVKEWKATEKEPYESLPNVLVDPDISKVKHIKRQYWKIENGIIVEKNEDEKKETDAWHKIHCQTNPKVITVEKVVEKKVVEEVVKEIQVEKKVVEFKAPIWCYVVIATLATIITIMIGVDFL